MQQHFQAACKVAVVGAGRMAEEHIRAFTDIPGVEIAGIFSRTRARAEQLASRYGIPVVADSLAELWNRTGAALVVVTVNVQFVAGLVRQCTRWPWKILAEKPVGLNAEASMALLNDLGKGGDRVFVALNRRFYGSTLAVHARLKDDPSPRYIEVFDQQEPDKLLQAGFDPVEIQNWMYANSIHLVDYLSFFGRGDVEEVQSIFPWTEPAPLAVAASVRFSSGDRGMYHAVWNAPAPWAVSVTSRSCRWEMRPLERVSVQEAGTRVRRELEPDPLDSSFKPGLRRQAEEAVKAALNLPSRSVSLREADATMQLIGMIYQRD